MSYVNQEAAETSGEEISFSFGSNWKRFAAQVDETAIQSAIASFVRFTRLDRLDDHDFLDIGCGSGLSSLIAIRLGARRVVSVDIDPHSVECTQKMRDAAQITPDRWRIERGSALDQDFLTGLGQFSYVYSWGVLHHTGRMWPAIENLLSLNVQPHGLLHLALYNAHPHSERWLRVKRACNRSPRFAFPLIKAAYMSAIFAKMLLRGKSPLRFLREYRRARGMSYVRDVDDWLRGLPYEYCSPAQVVDYLVERRFALLRLSTTRSCGCNEYLFRSEGASGASERT